jgi:hypothetical protein
MNEILIYLQKPEVKENISSMSLDEFKSTDRAKWFHNWVMFERAFRTVKNHPNSRHDQALSYPELIKFSDFVEEIHIFPYKTKKDLCTVCGKSHEKVNKRNAVNNSDGLIFLSTFELSTEGKNKLGIPLEYFDFPWQIYVKPKDGLRIDFLTTHIGSLSLYDRPDGVFIQANSSNYIGCNWLGIVKEFDIQLTIHN